MKQRKLEILLEEIEGFSSPELELEQYQTPSLLAAEILHFAYMQGDLADSVQDLGCGTGILAIGAKLLGAKKVIGYDTDSKALEIARKNAEKFGAEVEFINSDITEVSERVKTTVMNPPFGA
ncbi:MAG: putative methylase, partial [Euryarchaeota archaeon]|nr:putative methylase [Euryarchaeota archaeon]